MKFKSSLIALGLATFSLSAVALDQTTTPSTDPTNAATTMPADANNPASAANPNANPAANPSANAQKDAEVLAFLVVVNKNEVAAAKEALKHHLAPAVKRYAQMMENDHSKNLKQTLSVSHKIKEQPVDTDLTNQLKDKGKSQLTELKNTNDPQFQVSYVDAMVKGHGEVLQQLDEYISQVNNPQLKKHLEATRSRVSEHLEKAKSLQSELQSQPQKS